MGKWIKQNLVLVSGIVLPVLLVGAFLLLQSPARFDGEPPRHDFLFAAYQYGVPQHGDFDLSFEVRDRRLHVQATPLDDKRRGGRQNDVALYRYDAKRNQFTEITWEMPAQWDELDESTRFVLPETHHLVLDKARRSPDGFVFEPNGVRGRGGLLGELFGMGYRHERRFVLNRDGAYFQLPALEGYNRYYGSNFRFLGWVMDEEES